MSMALLTIPALASAMYLIAHTSFLQIAPHICDINSNSIKVLLIKPRIALKVVLVQVLQAILINVTG